MNTVVQLSMLSNQQYSISISSCFMDMTEQNEIENNFFQQIVCIK